MSVKVSDLVSDFEFPEEQEQAKGQAQKEQDFVISRQICYRQTFNKALPPVAAVLKDLANFCRANRSTFHENPSIQSRLDGRREVWLRIQQHLNMSPDELHALLKTGRGL